MSDGINTTKSFEFYTEKFDVGKPPPAPPNRDMWCWPLIGWTERRKSRRRTMEYKIRLDEYGRHFER